MKEALASAGPQVDTIDSPIPKAGPYQMIVKVFCVGLNPKDWKVADGAVPGVTRSKEGDDFAGIVHQVGESVIEFQAGDRVGVFYKTLSPGGGWAEYAIAWESMAFHLADHVSFEEASTVPLAAVTAALGLYHRLPLRYPWDSYDKPLPLVVYGAASAVGAYAIKLAALSNIHPIIAVAGRGIHLVETLIDRSCGDTIIDYRQGDEAVVKALKAALGNKEPHFAFDAVSEQGTILNICKVINKANGQIAIVLPIQVDSLPEGIALVNSAVETSQVDLGKEGSKDQTVGITHFTSVILKFLGRGLNDGWFTPHPHEVVPGGLYGLQDGLTRLKNGAVSATKLVVRIADTDGLDPST